MGSDDHNLYALDADGNLKWVYTASDQIAICSPAIGVDGTIYIGSHNGMLYAINPDGSLKWSFSTGYYLTSSPVIDATGTVYIYSNENGLYAINQDGIEKWRISASGSSWNSSPAIGSDGTIYVGGYDNTLYAIGGAADIQIAKSVDPLLAAPGDPVTYTLAFSYTGDIPASGVVITDIIPSRLSALSYQASPGLVVTDTGYSPSSSGKCRIWHRAQAG